MKKIAFFSLLLGMTFLAHGMDDASELILAVKSGDKDAVIKLLDDGVNPNGRLYIDEIKIGGLSPLSYAAALGQKALAKEICKRAKALPDSFDWDRENWAEGLFRIHPHVDFKHIKRYAKALLTAATDKDSADYKYLKLQAACNRGDYDGVVKWCEVGAPVCWLNGLPGAMSLLCFAAGGKIPEHIKIAEYLIAQGAPVNLTPEEVKQGSAPPIVCAIKYSTQAMVDLLLEHDAKVDFESTGVDLLAECFYQEGHSHKHKVIEVLLNAGCQLTELQPFWLREVAKIGDIKCVELLIHSGIDMNEEGKLGEHPLLRAAHGRQWQVCELLFKSGITVPKNANLDKQKDLLKSCAQAYRDIIKKFEQTIDEAHRDEYKKVQPYCEDLALSQEILDTFEQKIFAILYSADYNLAEVRKLSSEKLKELFKDKRLNDIPDLDEASDETILDLIHAYQRAKIVALVDYLKDSEGSKPPSIFEHTLLIAICEDIIATYKTIDVLKEYQANPLSLRDQCANKIRKLAKEGKLKKEELPCHLAEFGFKRLLISQKSAEKKESNDDNNNNNEDEK